MYAAYSNRQLLVQEYIDDTLLNDLALETLPAEAGDHRMARIVELHHDLLRVRAVVRAAHPEHSREFRPVLLAAESAAGRLATLDFAHARLAG